jgi:hypothetical protein
LEARNLLDAASLAPMPAPWVQVFHGDFNGDGKQDVAGIDSSGQWWVSLSTGTSFTPRTQWAQWSIPSSWSKLFVGDVNGDGKDDIVGFGYNGAWFVGLSNGTDTFDTNSPWAHWSVPESWSQILVADFNGDHKADIAGLGVNGAWFVGLSNGTDIFATGSAWAQWSLASSWRQVFAGDFNGDGKQDVAGFGVNGAWFVGQSNGVNAFVTGAAWEQWSNAASWRQVFVGDMNGDKKDDIVGFGATNLWFVGLSNGTNHFTTGAAWADWSSLKVSDFVSDWNQISIADVNGDGKADIVGFKYVHYYDAPPGGTEEWYIGLSNATDSFVSYYDGSHYFNPQTPSGGNLSPSIVSNIMTADFTGDGAADVSEFTTISGGTSFSYSPAWDIYISPRGYWSGNQFVQW